jgi:RHS repeat-associated protein
MNERIYLGGFEIYREYQVDGAAVALERETLNIMDDQQRVALAETRTQGADGSPAQLIRYQMGNHLGSACLELDAEADVISYEEYHPYGSTAYQAGRSVAEASLKRYRYTGKERDEETGLNYHEARYYASWLGRWIVPDPIGLRDGVNPLAYVGAEGPVGTKRCSTGYGRIA